MTFKEHIRFLLCWYGFHTWNLINTGKNQPTRECPHCGQQQGLFRGAGSDDWMNI